MSIAPSTVENRSPDASTASRQRAQLLADPGGAVRRHRRVRERVVADGVARRDRPPDELRLALGPLADEEEGRLRVVAREQLEQPRGALGVRAVVVGQRDALARPALAVDRRDRRSARWGTGPRRPRRRRQPRWRPRPRWRDSPSCSCLRPLPRLSSCAGPVAARVGAGREHSWSRSPRAPRDCRPARTPRASRGSRRARPGTPTWSPGRPSARRCRSPRARGSGRS